MNTLVKWNKHQDTLAELGRDIFNDLLNDPFFGFSRNWRAEAINETDKDYLFEVELPRVKKDQVKVEVIGDSIKVSAKNERLNYTRAFEATNADFDKTEVKLEDGVLSVKIPKKADIVPKTKLIEIK